MAPYGGYQQGSSCPRCGAVLERWPHLDGSGYVLSCSVCLFLVTEAGVQTEEEQRTFPELIQDRSATSAPALEPELSAHPPADDQSTGAFRALVESEKTPTGPLDPDEFEGVSEEVQALLKKIETGPLPAQEEPDDAGSEPASEITHISPFYSGVDRKTGQLGPDEIVDLASDEDVETMECPHCQATIAVDLERCPWCDTLLD